MDAKFIFFYPQFSSSVDSILGIIFDKILRILDRTLTYSCWTHSEYHMVYFGYCTSHNKLNDKLYMK